MKQRTLLIRVQVDADKYEGHTDEQIMEELFKGQVMPGGAAVDPFRFDPNQMIMAAALSIMNKLIHKPDTSIFTNGNFIKPEPQ